MISIDRHPAIDILEGIRPENQSAVVYRCVLYAYSLTNHEAVAEWTMWHPVCNGWLYDPDEEDWYFSPPQPQTMWMSTAVISDYESRHMSPEALERLLKVKLSNALLLLEERIAEIEKGRGSQTLANLAKFYRLAEIKSRHKPRKKPRNAEVLT